MRPGRALCLRLAEDDWTLQSPRQTPAPRLLAVTLPFIPDCALLRMGLDPGAGAGDTANPLPKHCRQLATCPAATCAALSCLVLQPPAAPSPRSQIKSPRQGLGHVLSCSQAKTMLLKGFCTGASQDLPLTRAQLRSLAQPGSGGRNGKDEARALASTLSKASRSLPGKGGRPPAPSPRGEKLPQQPVQPAGTSRVLGPAWCHPETCLATSQTRGPAGFPGLKTPLRRGLQVGEDCRSGDGPWCRLAPRRPLSLLSFTWQSWAVPCPRCPCARAAREVVQPLHSGNHQEGIMADPPQAFRGLAIPGHSNVRPSWPAAPQSRRPSEG